ncbi:choline/glycine/proline betaine transport protein [Barrientosiimonas humi]|uniref:Choline/glycine/proline betaine transport protein n=1 Tax=Barrientosiimonas humi TaxID=999931 RepID=A0A542XCH0_9MICO|nr:choline BCCT transporter BetT [Barrientosiimonas humi]TQL33527.1 choline/glycine/proline betaine transport protein [Barrientosiimonas humi]CAG7573515.1 High-affinity choline transport protein [Barrientosiimonas humi]
MPVPAETTPESALDPPRVRKVVFGTSASLVAVFAIFTLAAPGTAEDLIGGAVTWISSWFGWWYFLLATVIVGFVLYVALSKFGAYRLGPEESRPEYSLFTWTSMLFAAGIGIDLMFFSVAEPVAQYLSPPEGGGRTDGAAREAVEWTLFHYGITGWSMYALMGLSLGYFAFRRRLPLAIRSALVPVLGRRAEGRLGDVVDVAAVLGTIFGIATSLGIGIVQLNYGLDVLFGIPQGKAAQIGLILLSVVLGTISAVTGVDRGIRRLSELNVVLSLLLLLWVLVGGSSGFLLNGLVMNTGDYLSGFLGKTMDTMAWSAPAEWLNAWTLFFWAWWIAWAPFVGLFLARISRGRTVREFVLGVLTIPFVFILLWVSIFGNSALAAARRDEGFAQRTYDTPEAGFYSLLQTYPWATFVVGVATLTGLLYYVTSADSGALVMGNFTSRLSHPMQDCGRPVRIFWSVAIGVLTLGMLFAGGEGGSIVTLQNATIIMGLPFSFVLALLMVGLYRSLREESMKLATTRASLHTVLASGRGETRPVSWKQRLARTATFPGLEATERFLTTRARPALESVAAELRSAGTDAEVDLLPGEAGQPGSPRLRVSLLGVPDFVYRICAVPARTPSFAASRAGESGEHHYRSEVYLAEGSQGYHVNGYTAEQLIGDVLDHYEHHLSFVHAAHPAGEPNLEEES